MLSLAQTFRVNGHEIVVVSGEEFSLRAAEAGLTVYDAAPGFYSEAENCRQEATRKASPPGSRIFNLLMEDYRFSISALEVTAEMAQQPTTSEVARTLISAL